MQLDRAIPRSASQGDQHAEAVQRPDLDAEQHDAQQHGEALLDVSADRHGQGTGDAVRREGADVENKCQEPVPRQDEHQSLVWQGAGGGSGCHERRDLSAEKGAPESLDEGEGRQAQEGLQGRESQGPSHDAVRRDGLRETLMSAEMVHFPSLGSLASTTLLPRSGGAATRDRGHSLP